MTSSDELQFIDILATPSLYRYLSYIDKVMISFCSKQLHSYISANYSFLSVIKNELGKYLDSDQLEKFLTLIKEHKAIISGSFILACIFGETWYNDIDIYENYSSTQDKILVKKSRKVNVENFLIDTEYSYSYYVNIGDEYLEEHIKWSAFTPISKFLYFRTSGLSKDYVAAGLDWTDDRKFADRVREFIIKGMRFQHIPLSYDPKLMISKTFDTNSLKNIFDGERLRVWSWDLLLKKRDWVKPTLIFLHNYCELRSCPDDGICIHNGQFSLDIIREKVSVRIKKYKKRDFQFEFHPLFSKIYYGVLAVISDKIYQLKESESDKHDHKWWRDKGVEHLIADPRINFEEYDIPFPNLLQPLPLYSISPLLPLSLPSTPSPSLPLPYYSPVEIEEVNINNLK